MQNKKIQIFLLLSAFLAGFLLISFFKNGTGNAGDSIQHYLIAKFAFKHPHLFLDHWGKPLFTLIAAPFAQFGFTGMKVMNTLIAVLTGYFTYRTAQAVKYQDTLLAPVFLFFIPLYFLMTFSAMTEHLFAFVLILSIYLLLRNRILLGVILISFLPFIRSEGLIFIIVFIVWLSYIKRFKALPWLLSGHIVYSIAGYFHYKDIFWVFTEIPYLNIGSPYGQGTIFDFFSKLYYVAGLPLYVLLGLGTLFILTSLFVSSLRKKDEFPPEFILILGGFAAFFVAHSLFWGLGIFNSMGLGRVMVSVAPLIALLALKGLGTMGYIKKNWLQKIMKLMMVSYVLIFPFTHNPAAIHWDKDLNLMEDQQLITEAAEYIKLNLPDAPVCYSHPYWAVPLDIDPFDNAGSHQVHSLQNLQNSNCNIFLWDSWFSVVENGIHPEILRSNNQFQHLKTIKGEKYSVTVFHIEN